MAVVKPERVPPHSLDAEKSLLGGALLEGTAFKDVADIVSSEEFYRDSHRKVYAAMASLYEDGLPIDRVAVKDRLAELGLLEAVGGDEFIDSLDTITPVAANLAYYAKIIHEKALIRRAIDTATQIAQLGHELHGPVREFVAEAGRRWAAVAEDCEAAKVAVPADKLRTDGLSASDFLRLEFPPAAWIVPDMIEKASTGELAGPPNSGKTLLAMDSAARATAYGYRAIFYELEGSPDKLQRRVRRALKAHLDARPENLLIIYGADLNLTDLVSVGRLVERIKAFKADLVFVDSFAAATRGLDENDSASMGSVANNINAVRVSTGAAVWALHHLTKEGWGKGEPELRHLRGHGSAAGMLDVVLAVKPVQSAEGEVTFDLHDLKQREAGKRAPRRGTFKMMGEAADLAMAETPPNSTKAISSTADPLVNNAGLKSRILLELQQEPRSAPDLARRMKIRKETAYQLCADLEGEGAAVKDGAKYYPKTVPAVPNGSGELAELVNGNGSHGSLPLREPGTGTDPGTDACDDGEGGANAA